MAVVSLTVRDFRSYERATVRLGAGLTVVHGANGAGKTNLLEALYVGCTGRSCRTANDRELVRFGAAAARVVVTCDSPAGAHEFAVGLAPGEPKRMTADGAPVERLLDAPFRPLVSVFLPDRLDLVKGPPAGRRAHVDQVVAALWPARAAIRRDYARVLAQRNALIGRMRARGRRSDAALPAWDAQLARLAIALIATRRDAIAMLAPRCAEMSAHLGLEGEIAFSYQPRSRADDPAALVAELEARLESDLDRGFTGHGPHRDELSITLNGRELRTFGSQGQQRVALLALLLAEREAIGERRGVRPLALLDDVMSELDASRRGRLVELIRTGGGQTLISTTEVDHVPGATDAGVTRIAVAGGSLLQEAAAA